MKLGLTQIKRPLFTKVLRDAEPGDELVYHIGTFCAGRLAADAWLAYERREVILYQRKLPEAMYEYIAKVIK